MKRIEGLSGRGRRGDLPLVIRTARTAPPPGRGAPTTHGVSRRHQPALVRWTDGDRRYPSITVGSDSPVAGKNCSSRRRSAYAHEPPKKWKNRQHRAVRGAVVPRGHGDLVLVGRSADSPANSVRLVEKSPRADGTRPSLSTAPRRIGGRVADRGVQQRIGVTAGGCQPRRADRPDVDSRLGGLVEARVSSPRKRVRPLTNHSFSPWGRPLVRPR